MLSLLMWPFHAMGWILGGIIGLLIFGLWAYCMYDCITRRFRDPNQKIIWIVVLLASWAIGMPFLAAGAYLIFGRQRAVGY